MFSGNASLAESEEILAQLIGEFTIEQHLPIIGKEHVVLNGRASDDLLVCCFCFALHVEGFEGLPFEVVNMGFQIALSLAVLVQRMEDYLFGRHVEAV